MNHPRLFLAAALIAFISAVPVSAQSGGRAASSGLRVYPSPYYIIHTDIDADDEREAAIRMTRMAEEYHARTSDFSGTISAKLPFFLYRKADDYYAAGAPAGSAGVFMGDKLMAIAGDKSSGWTWHVIQHEGFHQFVAAVIGGDIPIWANEGMAEYFGESLFTGDGFVSGLVPPGRLDRVKKEIEGGQFKSAREMMLFTPEQWNSRLTTTNYDQAWSMVHFLAHGENGRYQQAFSGFMKSVSHGANWQQAWQVNFGDAVGFDQRWRDYWTNLPENATAPLYNQATVATLTSFLGRAAAQKQKFDSFDAFRAAAVGGELKAAPEDWLPPALLKSAAESIDHLGGAWSLEPGPDKLPRLVCVLDDKTRQTGIFTLKGNRVGKVSVEIDDMARTIASARTLLDAGKKEAAREMLQQALRRLPKSPAADEARKMLGQIKR